MILSTISPVEFFTVTKIKYKLQQLQQNEWFIVDDYIPLNNSIFEIHNFYEKLIYHPKIKEFLNYKKRNSPIPSFIDMALISFSKDKNYPIITNDRDLTFFKMELIENNLSSNIYNLKELEIQ